MICGIAAHGISFAQARSPVGNNVMYCMRRYKFARSDFLSEQTDSRHVRLHLNATAANDKTVAAEFLRELVGLREGTLLFTSGSMFLTPADLSVIVT